MVDVLLVAARCEFILGGQKSGKSRRAEALAQQWLTASPDHQAVLIATAQPWDIEMEARIARHQADRAQRVPGMRTVEEPLALADALRAYSAPNTLVVVDCLTLWLTNCLMPMTEVHEENRPLALIEHGHLAILLEAIHAASGPVLLVGNEIGLGVIPMGSQVRAFVDTLGRLNQDVAATCERVTLMVAGQPLTLKGSA